MHISDILIKEAKEIQTRLSEKLVVGGKPHKIDYVAAVDVAYINEENISVCAVVLFSYLTLELQYVTFCHNTISYPYIPGLLYLREGPIILKTFQEIKIQPDIIILDGQGIAHPRRFGLASYIGLCLNIPAIGCAKSSLYGSYEEPGKKKGSRSILYDELSEPIGVVLRSRDNVKPVFISPGHLVGINESVEIVINCLTTYRIPEPLRFADIEVNKYKKKLLMNF